MLAGGWRPDGLQDLGYIRTFKRLRISLVQRPTQVKILISHSLPAAFKIKFAYLYFVVAITMTGVFYSSSTFAQVSSKKIAPPSFLTPVAPKYPDSQVRKGNAGAVEISLMVDEKGKPFDLVVLRSSDKAFNRSAKSAVAKYRYTPALQDGKAVSSRSRVVIYYEIEGQMNSLSRDFHAWMKKNNSVFIDKDATSDSLEKALKTARRKARSRCDHSFLALFQNVYETKFGTSEQRIESYYFAIMFDDEIAPEFRCFTDEQEAFIYGGLLHELARAERWGEFLYTYRKTLSLGLESVAAPFKALVSELNSTQDDVSKAFVSFSETNEKDLVAEIFSPSFDIGTNVNTAQLKRLSLRCENGFTELEILDGPQYRQPKELVNCQLLAETK